MSNSLAIATVTATLQRIVQTSIQDDISGATVTTLRPNEVGTATPQVGVNVFLYQVQINHAWRQEAEVRARSRTNPGAKRSHTALDLHYMISFYGNDN
ncbi:MAG: Pvc16 family protein, partial [Coleofasciculus sp. C2-GNP5-27]